MACLMCFFREQTERLGRSYSIESKSINRRNENKII